MTQTVNDEIMIMPEDPVDDDATLPLALATEGQPNDERRSDPKTDHQDATPEEAGYGYGV